MKRKKRLLIGLWLSIILFFTSLFFSIVGYHSDFLINKLSFYITCSIIIISLICIIMIIIKLLKYKRLKGYNKITKIIISIICALYGIASISALVLLYGPNKDFENWLITTAMQTMHHRHYCRWFYSEAEINKVMSENTIEEIIEDTNTDLITHEEKIVYENEYEEAILDREEGALYKIIRFKVNDCNAYLAAIYDPSRVHVGVTSKLGISGNYVTTMSKQQNSIISINGGGFIDPNYNSNGANPLGVTISEGKVITNDSYSSTAGLIGFDNNNNLILMKGANAEKALASGIRDAVTMGPFLIVNGKSSFIRGNGGWGLAARTAIGQRADGIVLFLVVDSNEFRTKGASMIDLTEIMENYGAINASNLDGGTSSVMVVDGELINDPIDSTLKHKTRPIPTFFKVV